MTGGGERRTHARVGQVIGWLGQVLAWCVILAVAAVLCIGVLVPRLAGASPYTVLSGSMTPTYPAGTLVVVKPADPADIGIGTVITYQVKSGEPTVVTHRVVTVSSLDGEPVFRTQGDANSTPDRVWVRPVQIKGKVWYSVPYLGHVNNLLTGHQRQLAVYVVAGLLLAYAAFMFTSSISDRRSSRHSEKKKEEVSS